MNRVFALYKKEVTNYFLSPLAYILSAVFIFLTGWSFYNAIELVSQNQTFQVQNLIQALVSNMNTFFIFLAPLLTMRLFSEEKKMNTESLLFTSSLSDTEIILGKYLASFSVLLFMMALALIFPIVLTFSGLKVWHLVFTSYLGLTLNIMAYLSIGLFASSLTANQALAAFISFLLFFVFYLLGWSAQTIVNYSLSSLLQYIGITSHFYSFAMGGIKSTDIFYYLSFTIFFLFLSHKSLQSRRW